MPKPAAAPALPGIHDRCTCGCLASMHDIGTRRGVKVRTACACGTCNCRTYQHEGAQP